jgi:hypothetical protein
MNKTLAFLTGCAVGTIATLLVTPRSGKELRGSISTKVREGYDTVSGKVEEGRRAIRDRGGIRGVVEQGIERGRKAVNFGHQRENESVETGTTSWQP